MSKLVNVAGKKLPVLSLAFPRRVTMIHQIEITSRCQLRCSYCPSPRIMKGELPGRPAMDMTREVYERALYHVAAGVRAGTQGELNLAGIGESTLHPEFFDFVRLAREAVGPSIPLIIATNGIIATPELAELFVREQVNVWVSLHRPEKAGLAVQLYRAAGVLRGISHDPSVNANDWAGQVAWHNSPGNAIPCEWLRQGYAMVLSDGRVTACCFDVTGEGVGGHVNDETLGATSPYRICADCHHVIGVEGFDQRPKSLPVVS